jgi:hypothetical protein
MVAGFITPAVWAPFHATSGSSSQALGQYYGLPVVSLRSAAYPLMLRNASGYVVRAAVQQIAARAPPSQPRASGSSCPRAPAPTPAHPGNMICSPT